MQRVLFWIKPIAEHIGQLTFPRGTHFYCREYWELFFRRQLLQRGDGIYTIMIGDGYQAKSLTHKVLDQLFRSPGAITVYGMHLQVNGNIRSQYEMRSQCFQNLLLPKRSHLHSTDSEQRM